MIRAVNVRRAKSGGENHTKVEKRRGLQEEAMQRVILVVAHDASVRSEVSQALRREGCLVLAVPDGTMGLDVASHVPFVSFFASNG